MDSSKLNAKQTLVEEGTQFNGTLTSNCQVVVNGTIDGEIQAPELRVSASGVVLGSIKAHKLRAEGVLGGSIDAVDVYLSGTVRSNTIIRASKLEAKLATEQGRLEVTFGECLLEIGEDPALAHGRAPSARAEPSVESVRAPISAGAASVAQR
jgi:cytoskeletal protein CcmA (bactofilin family)